MGSKYVSWLAGALKNSYSKIFQFFSPENTMDRVVHRMHACSKYIYNKNSATRVFLEILSYILEYLFFKTSLVVYF